MIRYPRQLSIIALSLAVWACAQEVPHESVTDARRRAEAFERAKDTIPLMVAGNTDPFWRLEVMSGGMRFSTTKDGLGYPFTAGRVVGTDSASTWTTSRTGSGPHNLEFRLRKVTCNDPKNPEVDFPYAAVVIVDGRTLNGCATPTGVARYFEPPR